MRLALACLATAGIVWLLLLLPPSSNAGTGHPSALARPRTALLPTHSTDSTGASVTSGQGFVPLDNCRHNHQLYNFDEQWEHWLRIPEQVYAERRAEVRRVIASIPPYPGTAVFADTPVIVIPGGHAGSVPRVLTMVRLMRERLGVTLAVELWHAPGEVSASTAEWLQREYAIACCDFSDQRWWAHVSSEESGGWHLKALAVLATPHRHVLLLDADNLVVRDPAAMFATPEYKQHGTVFWPDYWKAHRDNPMWRLIDRPCEDENEVESGSMFVDKQRAWKGLNLAVRDTQKQP